MPYLSHLAHAGRFRSHCTRQSRQSFRRCGTSGYGIGSVDSDLYSAAATSETYQSQYSATLLSGSLTARAARRHIVQIAGAE